MRVRTTVITYFCLCILSSVCPLAAMLATQSSFGQVNSSLLQKIAIPLDELDLSLHEYGGSGYGSGFGAQMLADQDNGYGGYGGYTADWGAAGYGGDDGYAGGVGGYRPSEFGGIDVDEFDAFLEPKIRPSWIEKESFYNPIKNRPPANIDGSRLRVRWGRTHITPLGDRVTITGRIVLQHEETSKWGEPGWRLPITVALERETHAPEGTAESLNLRRNESWHQIAVSRKNGEFAATLRLGDILPFVAHERRVSIALGKIEQKRARHYAVWSSQDKTVEASVQPLQLPAREPLSEALLNVHAACSSPQSMVEMIRAVNVLWDLGDEQALATLEQYRALRKENSQVYETDGALIWIAHLLFEPIEMGQLMPLPKEVAPSDRKMYPDTWPLAPWFVDSDLPITRTNRWGAVFGGSGAAFYEHLSELRKKCVLRDRKLVPEGDPVKAFRRLETTPAISNLRPYAYTPPVFYFRAQVLRSLPAERIEQIKKLTDKDNSQWSVACRLAELSPVRWNEEQQCFEEQP